MVIIFQRHENISPVRFFFVPSLGCEPDDLDRRIRNRDAVVGASFVFVCTDLYLCSQCDDNITFLVCSRAFIRAATGYDVGALVGWLVAGNQGI